MKIFLLLANAICITVAAALFVPSFAFAQVASSRATPTSMLTLYQCIQKALAHNLQIRSAALQTEIANDIDNAMRKYTVSLASDDAGKV